MSAPVRNPEAHLAETANPATEPVVSGNAALDRVVNFAFDHAMKQAHWHLNDTFLNGTFEGQELKLLRAFRTVAQFKMQNAGKLTRSQAAQVEATLDQVAKRQIDLYRSEPAPRRETYREVFVSGQTGKRLRLPNLGADARIARATLIPKDLQPQIGDALRLDCSTTVVRFIKEALERPGYDWSDYEIYLNVNLFIAAAAANAASVMSELEPKLELDRWCGDGYLPPHELAARAACASSADDALDWLGVKWEWADEVADSWGRMAATLTRRAAEQDGGAEHAD